MTTTLITGANKGLGREAARRLVEAGHDVWIGARDPQKGQEAADAVGARFVALDVTDDASVRAAAEAVGALDVLVNNAGIVGPRYEDPEATTAADLATTLDTNLLGVLRVTQAFLPALRRSDQPVVVNVSSGLGSASIVSDPDRIEHGVANLTYNVSKAALNMLSLQFAKLVPEVRFTLVDPGYTATDLNGNSGHQTVTEGTDAMVAAAQEDPGVPHVDRDGAVGW